MYMYNALLTRNTFQKKLSIRNNKTQQRRSAYYDANGNGSRS